MTAPRRSTAPWRLDPKHRDTPYEGPADWGAGYVGDAVEVAVLKNSTLEIDRGKRVLKGLLYRPNHVANFRVASGAEILCDSRG